MNADLARTQVALLRADAAALSVARHRARQSYARQIFSLPANQHPEDEIKRHAGHLAAYLADTLEPHVKEVEHGARRTFGAVPCKNWKAMLKTGLQSLIEKAAFLRLELASLQGRGHFHSFFIPAHGTALDVAIMETSRNVAPSTEWQVGFCILPGLRMSTKDDAVDGQVETVVVKARVVAQYQHAARP